MNEPTDEEINKVLQYIFDPTQLEWDREINGKIYTATRTSRPQWGNAVAFHVFVYDKEES